MSSDGAPCGRTPLEVIAATEGCREIAALLVGIVAAVAAVAALFLR